jgi:homoserine O-acetyltransferase
LIDHRADPAASSRFLSADELPTMNNRNPMPHRVRSRTSPAAALLALFGLLAALQWSPCAAQPFDVHEGDFRIANFPFESGETLPELNLHYRTLGALQRDGQGHAANAVLILHGTGGSGAQFVGSKRGDELFAAELFGPGQPLDVQRYYIVIPDSIGHGRSSKPSDGLHARFPKYGYRDAVQAQFRLLTEGLGVDHLRLVFGTSMGGMHTWLWGERHPGFSDALMPMASLPTQISGRNRMWRRLVIDAIRLDPGWQSGEYKQQPAGLRPAVEMLSLMSSNPVLRQKEAPTLQAADQVTDRLTSEALGSTDANDLLYQVQSSFDYDPGPDLEKISAPLLAINTGDDLINPPELGILEREAGRVPHGRALLIPADDRTVGHGTHTKAVVWKDQLIELLRRSQR